MPTVNYQVAALTDDCEYCWSTNTFVDGNPGVLATATLGRISSTYYGFEGGFRFLGVAVPQGATITAATLTLYSDGSNTANTCNWVLWGDKEANATTFSSTPSAYSGRPRTSASVAYGAVPTFSNHAAITPPDISAIIQEIVNQAGWVSGNALVLFCGDKAETSTGNNSYRDAYLYHGGATYAAKLSITYTSGTNYPVSFSGGVTAGPSSLKAAAHKTAGGMTAAGSFAAAWGHAIAVAGGIVASGTLSTIWAHTASIVGGLTASPSAKRGASQSLSGIATASGATQRAAGRSVGGGLSASGGIGRLASQAVLWALGAASIVTRSATRSVSQAITSSGSRLQAATQLMGGTISATPGAIVRSADQTIPAMTVASPTIQQTASRSLLAGTTLSGSIGRGAAKVILTAESLSASILRRVGLTLQSIATAVGSFTAHPGGLHEEYYTPLPGMKSSTVRQDTRSGTEMPGRTVTKTEVEPTDVEVKQ